jgi:hypothetical protein
LDHVALLARSQPLTSLTELSSMLYGHSTVAEQSHDTNDIVRPKETKSQSPGTGASQASDLFLNFLYNYFPEEIRENNNYETPVSWLQAIGPLQRSNSSLDLAMSALSMVRLGRNRGNEQLESAGVANYGKALKDLQKVLSSDSLALEEQTLASCMTLTIFEACHPDLVCIRRG